MKKLFAFIFAMLLICSLAACGGAKDDSTAPAENTAEEQTEEAAPATEEEAAAEEPEEANYPDTPLGNLEAFADSLSGVEVEGLNAYNSSFDDVVAYLTDAGVISADAKPVDINKNAGYFYRYDGDCSEVMACADAAYDYDGVYLYWWNIAGGSGYTDIYSDVKDAQTILIGGGEYTAELAAVNGYFAIGFADAAKTAQDWTYGSDNFYTYVTTEWSDTDTDAQEEYNAQYDAFLAAGQEAVNNVLATHQDALDAFNGIDNTKTDIDQYSAEDMAKALQQAGIITEKELQEGTNLNEQYVYTTTDGYYALAFLADSAMQYGNLTVYYFDTESQYWEGSVSQAMYESLCSTGSTPLYYDPEGYCVFNADNIFETYGNQISYSVDFVCGDFAFALAE